MKKLVVLVLASLLLVGCYDKTTNVSDKASVLITLDNKTITKGDVYSVMSKEDKYPAIIALTLSKKIILAKEVGITAEVTVTADAALAAWLVTNKANVQKALDDAGYKTQKEIYDEKFVIDAQSNLLVSKYLDSAYATIVSTYRPMKARVMEIATNDKATAALAALKAGDTFAAVATKYGNNKYSSDLKIYHTGSTLPDLVLSFLQAQSSPTLSDVLVDADNSLYYIVQISVADGNMMKAEAIASMQKETSFIELALLGYYESDKFRIYDRTLYDIIKANYPNYIVN